MTPKQFLQEISLKTKPDLECGSDRYLAEIRRCGFDPDSLRDQSGFGTSAGDAFFCSESVARATLYGNRARYRDHLQHLGEFRGFRSSPARIADIGAGAAITSLFLAKNHPGAVVRAFDWADRPLKFGQLLANELRASNISFHRASYEDLASGYDPGGYDLVLSLYGLNFTPTDEGLADFQSGQVNPPRSFCLMASAIARLLIPNTGVAAICGNWNEWAALNLFEALRRAELTVDWDITFTKGKVEDNVFVTNLGYVFVRSGIPPITGDSWEDVQGFFASGEIDESKLNFSVGATSAFSRLFENGRELVRIEVTKNTLKRQVRLLSKAGLLSLGDETSNGLRRACLKSLCELDGQLQKIENLLEGFRGDEDVRLDSVEIDSSIAYLLPRYPLLAKHGSSGRESAYNPFVMGSRTK